MGEDSPGTRQRLDQWSVFSFSNKKMILGQPWIVTRRVPLQQKGKVRLIDDCLSMSSGRNSAFSAANKLRLMAEDTLVAPFLCISGRHAVGFGCCQSPRQCIGAMILFDVCLDVWIHSGGVFKRLSRSLWHLQTCLLSIMGTVYYDDFPMLELRSTAGSALRTVAETSWVAVCRGRRQSPPF